MSRTKVEWADYQWNPLTGAPGGSRTGPHTYMGFSGDIRWNLKNLKYRKDGDIYILDEKPVGPSGSTLMYPFGSAPTYHRYKERFDALKNMQSPRNILVCQESDLFGPWVPDWIIKEVMEFLDNFNYHFLFVTEYPERLKKLADEEIIITDDHFWYGIKMQAGTVFNPFKECADATTRWFVVNEPVVGSLVFEDRPLWLIFGEENETNSDLIDMTLENRLNAEFKCKKPIPTFVEGDFRTREKEFPRYLRLSEKEKNKLYGTCTKCGNVHFKNEMYTLTARLGKEPSFTYGYMCHDCMSRERPINE